MLKYRLILGPILIIGILGLMFLDEYLGIIQIETGIFIPPGLPLYAFFVLTILAGAKELTAIAAAKNIEINTTLTISSTLLLLTYIYLKPTIHVRDHPHNAVGGFTTILLATMILALIIHSVPRKKPEGALAASGATCFAALYMGVLPAFFLAIRAHHSAYVVATVILVTKSCDIGAYFAGRQFGKRKLIPWLSPGKSWEGLIGGLMLSSAVAVAVTLAAQRYGGPDYTPPLPLWAAALAGVAFGLVGHGGDLMISLLKRDAGMKDSSKSVPGFGGILDVIDSPLPVAPLAYWLLV
jgi:phosphatidate cytidylyltransferase